MKFAALAVIATASAQQMYLLNLDSFPAMSSFHAGCKTTTTIQADCATTFVHLDHTVKANGAVGPAGGAYGIHSEVDNKLLWVTRTNPTKHYVDDIEFTLTPATAAASAYNVGGETCIIDARSRSESISYLDYDTNYCNMWNVVRKSGLDFDHFKTVGKCSGTPTDAERLATCNKY